MNSPGVRERSTARTLLAAESSPIFTNAPLTVGLVWPNSYESGMASLGFQWAYRAFNLPGAVGCERFFAGPPCWQAGREALSLERSTPLSACDLIAVSISYELDLVPLIRMLIEAGLEPCRENRPATEPLLLIGGPLTRSNPLPLGALADLVVCGDGEPAAARLVAALTAGTAVAELPDALAGAEGLWRPGREAAPPPARLERLAEPVVAPVATAHGSLGSLRLLEVSRGCPRTCTFCLGRRANEPLRLVPTEAVLAAMREGEAGFGLIGAGLGYHPGFRQMVEQARERRQRVGINSLRAEMVDRELAEALAATGSTVLTVAADGCSRRLRQQIGKEVTADHLLRCAELGREVGLRALKLYLMVGFPDETDEDLLELAELANRLHDRLPLLLSISPLVPKRNTPLADAPVVSAHRLQAIVRLLRRELRGGIRSNQPSARETALQYLLSHADEEDGHRLVEVARRGGSFADFRALYGDRIQP